MKHFFGTLAALALLASTSACKKHDHHTNPAEVSTTISSPAAGQAFRIGDTVRIQAAVQYSGEMHGYKVVVSDSATAAELWSTGENHVHGDRFSIDESWIPASGQLGTKRLQVRTAIDHEGTEAVKDVYFYVLP